MMQHTATEPQRLIVAITGASGAVYGLRLLQVLQQNPQVETHLLISEAVFEYHQKPVCAAKMWKRLPTLCIRCAISGPASPAVRFYRMVW
jgi:3-polyprenyl-4-hydroxybenzoate decarboxylase